MKAHYKLVTHTPKLIAIADLGTGRSVTNAAEDVIDELDRAYGLDGKRVIYKDTDGVWDELMHADGSFVGFKPISTRDFHQACRKVGS